MKQPFRFCAISTGFVVLTFMLCSATIQTAQAQTCSTSTIDMKLLVVTNGRTEADFPAIKRSEEHTSELQSRLHLVCRLLLEKKKRSRLISMGLQEHHRVV